MFLPCCRVDLPRRVGVHQGDPRTNDEIGPRRSKRRREPHRRLRHRARAGTRCGSYGRLRQHAPLSHDWHHGWIDDVFGLLLRGRPVDGGQCLGSGLAQCGPHDTICLGLCFLGIVVTARSFDTGVSHAEDRGRAGTDADLHRRERSVAPSTALRRVAGPVPIEGTRRRDGAEGRRRLRCRLHSPHREPVPAVRGSAHRHRGRDTEEHLQAVLPDIDRRMRGGLITMEKVRVVHYEGTDR